MQRRNGRNDTGTRDEDGLEAAQLFTGLQRVQFPESHRCTVLIKGKSLF